LQKNFCPQTSARFLPKKTDENLHTCISIMDNNVVF
jgi:hypothetical protein